MTEDLQQLLDAAAPGPWGCATDGPHCDIVDDQGDDVAMLCSHDSAVNARLIALAPTLARQVIAAQKLAEAMRPFAKSGELFPEPIGTVEFDCGVYAPAAGKEYNLCGDDLRRARAALAEWEAAQ